MYIFLEINWDTNSLVFTLSYSDNTIDSVPYQDDAYTTYQKPMLNLNKVYKLLSQHLVWTDLYYYVLSHIIGDRILYFCTQLGLWLLVHPGCDLWLALPKG
jgi:hypothetical protein